MAAGEALGEDDDEEWARREGGVGLGFLSMSMPSSRYSSLRESVEGALWAPQGSPKGELAFPSHFKWRTAERDMRGEKQQAEIIAGGSQDPWVLIDLVLYILLYWIYCDLWSLKCLKEYPVYSIFFLFKWSLHMCVLLCRLSMNYCKGILASSTLGKLRLVLSNNQRNGEPPTPPHP